MHAQSTATSPEITTVVDQTNLIEAPAIQQKADNTLKGRTVSWLNLSAIKNVAKKAVVLTVNLLNTAVTVSCAAISLFLLFSASSQPNLVLGFTVLAASMVFSQQTFDLCMVASGKPAGSSIKISF